MVKTCRDGKGEMMSKVRTWGGGTVSLRWGRAKELKWGWFYYKTW